MLFSARKAVSVLSLLLAVVFAISASAQTGYWHTSGNQILDSSGHARAHRRQSTGMDSRPPTKSCMDYGRRTTSTS